MPLHNVKLTREPDTGGRIRTRKNSISFVIFSRHRAPTAIVMRDKPVSSAQQVITPILKDFARRGMSRDFPHRAAFFGAINANNRAIVPILHAINQDSLVENRHEWQDKSN